MPWGALLEGERSHGGPRESSTLGCPLGGSAMAVPGQEVQQGCRGGSGCPRGAEALREVPHSPSPFAPLPRKIPQTAAEGLPSPPPWGSCSPCSCCSFTPAPAGTRCPRPPAFSPPSHPPSSLFFQAPSPSSSPAQWSGSGVPSAASGTPAMPQPKKSRGAGRGSPAEWGPGRCPGIVPSQPLGLGKWCRHPLPATSPPHPQSTSPIFLA